MDEVNLPSLSGFKACVTWYLKIKNSIKKYFSTAQDIQESEIIDIVCADVVIPNYVLLPNYAYLPNYALLCEKKSVVGLPL